MQWEQDSALELGLNWTSEIWTIDQMADFPVNHQLPVGWRSFALRRLHLHARVRRAVQDYDVILVRYAPIDLFGPFLPRRCREKCHFVFHTKTNEYLRSMKALSGFHLTKLDEMLGRQMVRGARSLIGVTPEILEYERTRLRFNGRRLRPYPNGIHLPESADSPVDRRAGSYKIIFVASRFFDWNGLETLLGSVRHVETMASWELHLVGELTPAQLRFCENERVAPHVRIHGSLPNATISTLLAEMDLSLGAFNLQSLNMREACTLKVRESLGMGVPVYSGHADCAFPEQFPFYRVGPPEMSTIINHAIVMRGARRDSVRAAARPFIDKKQLLRDLWSQLASHGGREAGATRALDA